MLPSKLHPLHIDDYKPFYTSIITMIQKRKTEYNKNNFRIWKEPKNGDFEKGLRLDHKKWPYVVHLSPNTTESKGQKFSVYMATPIGYKEGNGHLLVELNITTSTMGSIEHSKGFIALGPNSVVFAIAQRKPQIIIYFNHEEFIPNIVANYGTIKAIASLEQYLTKISLYNREGPIPLTLYFYPNRTQMPKFRGTLKEEKLQPMDLEILQNTGIISITGNPKHLEATYMGNDFPIRVTLKKKSLI